mmetsp:Transcript_18652/g.29893  ORF Transcript_18652/g.29893 Transcript_18652/m.29893 type:complete len:91 (+) Transcript_18652:402-674(+)
MECRLHPPCTSLSHICLVRKKRYASVNDIGGALKQYLAIWHKLKIAMSQLGRKCKWRGSCQFGVSPCSRWKVAFVQKYEIAIQLSVQQTT